MFNKNIDPLIIPVYKMLEEAHLLGVKIKNNKRKLNVC